MSLRNRLLFNTKWHRRIGLFSAIFLVILSVTGLLLNHTSSLKLDSIKIHSSLIAGLYNLPNAKPVSFHVGEQWLSHNGINNLFLNQNNIAHCPAPLKGALSSNGLLVALCNKELLLLTQDGDLLERITPIYGLPEGSHALSQVDDQLLIKTQTGIVKADIDNLEFTPFAPKDEPIWLKPKPPSTELTQFLNDQGPAMDLEQILLDLHSGRLFGAVGVFMMDLAAILLIVLAITGFITWQTGIKMRAKR